MGIRKLTGSGKSNEFGKTDKSNEILPPILLTKLYE